MSAILVGSRCHCLCLGTSGRAGWQRTGHGVSRAAEDRTRGQPGAGGQDTGRAGRRGPAACRRPADAVGVGGGTTEGAQQGGPGAAVTPSPDFTGLRDTWAQVQAEAATGQTPWEGWFRQVLLTWGAAGDRVWIIRTSGMARDPQLHFQVWHRHGRMLRRGQCGPLAFNDRERSTGRLLSLICRAGVHDPIESGLRVALEAEGASGKRVQDWVCIMRLVGTSASAEGETWRPFSRRGAGHGGPWDRPCAFRRAPERSTDSVVVGCGVQMPPRSRSVSK